MRTFFSHLLALVWCVSAAQAFAPPRHAKAPAPPAGAPTAVLVNQVITLLSVSKQTTGARSATIRELELRPLALTDQNLALFKQLLKAWGRNELASALARSAPFWPAW